DQVDDPDEIAYEFVDGVRELLLEAAPLIRPADVLDRLSSFVAEHLRGEAEMQSRLAGVEGGAAAPGGAARPFAHISPALLRSLGGSVEPGPARPSPEGGPERAQPPPGRPDQMPMEGAPPSSAASAVGTSPTAAPTESPSSEDAPLPDEQPSGKGAPAP